MHRLYMNAFLSCLRIFILYPLSSMTTIEIIHAYMFSCPFSDSRITRLEFLRAFKIFWTWFGLELIGTYYSCYAAELIVL